MEDITEDVVSLASYSASLEIMRLDCLNRDLANDIKAELETVLKPKGQWEVDETPALRALLRHIGLSVNGEVDQRKLEDLLLRQKLRLSQATSITTSVDHRIRESLAARGLAAQMISDSTACQSDIAVENGTSHRPTTNLDDLDQEIVRIREKAEAVDLHRISELARPPKSFLDRWSG